MADMDVVNEESMDTVEYLEQSTFVENDCAADVGSTQSRNEENSRNGIGKNGDKESLHSVTEETQPDQESTVFDPDELELDDDDIASKLLSIQVLPRIPKRKPVTDDSTTTSVAETSSYYSVLERVNSSPSSVGARYPNWSAAGWSRSNSDRLPIPKRWSRKNTKDRKAESKPVKRTLSAKHPSSDTKNKTEVTDSKTKRATQHSAWSPGATDLSKSPSFSEIEQITADDRTASTTLSGPLPTLPFEEQMRERARLRNLKKGGFDIANDSSDATETPPKNFDSNDNSKDCFDSSAVPSFVSDKTETSSKPVVSQGHRDVKMPSFANSTVLSHTTSSERHRLSQHHQSENGHSPGHSHSHKTKKPIHHTNRTSADDKTKQSRFTGMKDTKPVKTSGDESITKSKKEPASPPLPHLPILPLFATTASETSDSSLHRVENKTTTSRKKTAALSSSVQIMSAVSDSSDIGRSMILKPKPPTSATTTAAGTTGTKSVTFNCNTELQGGGSETKRKSKPKVH